MNDKQQVTQAAALVMVAFAASRVLGLVRQMVFGVYFGTGAAMDTYTAAQRVPEALFLVIAGGALGSAFIPTFAARLAQHDTADAWKLASAVTNLLMLIVLPITLICIVIAPWLVRVIIAPAFPPASQLETANLMRVMLLSTIIFGASGIVMGALNAHQHFLLPAVAPILYNVALIGGAVVGGVTPLGPMGPALGMVVGSLAHLLIQVPGLLRYRARYTFTLGRGDPGVREVGLLMAPRVMGMAAQQLNFIVSNNLASRLGPGAVSTLDYAWRVMMLPEGVFAQAVGTAAFPTFAAQAARREFAQMRETLAATLKTIIAITLPATVGLIAVGQPIIALMFQRGEFDAASTRSVAWALAFFALGLIGHSGLEILSRAFYALHDTWTPALIAIVNLLCNVTLGILLPPVFRNVGWPPHAGLALANALAVLVEGGALLALIHRRVGSMRGYGLPRQLGRVALASTGMALALGAWRALAPDAVLIQSLGGVLLGGLVYLGLAHLLDIHEIHQLIHSLLTRNR